MNRKQITLSIPWPTKIDGHRKVSMGMGQLRDEFSVDSPCLHPVIKPAV